MPLLQLAQRLTEFEPNRIPWTSAKAAVLIPLTISSAPEIILTRRAQHMPTHSGQVAFPGGMYNQVDQNLQDTALREAKEEISIPPEQVKIIGSLSDRLSMHRIKVTPFVGLIPTDLSFTPEIGEVDAIFPLPLAWLLQDPRSHTDAIQFDNSVLYIPSYQYGEFVIWGLTALILAELLEVGFGINMHLQDKPDGLVVTHIG